ncbi:MAG: HD domain-containing protein [Campylobacterales bacterium]|nr:HD domain-containing protein [Campylobacterales bacterium]
MREALEYLQTRPQEQVLFRFSSDHRDFRFAGVLHTQTRCLECHGDFRVGDLRGGIEITLPLQTYREGIDTIESQFRLFAAMVLGVYLLGLGGLLYFIRHLFAQKEKIESMNASLEQKVADRTKEVQILYAREHYLKGLLQTIAELNESLINTYSLESIIKTSVETLTHHPNYCLIYFGHFDGSVLHQRYVLGDHYRLFDKEHIPAIHLHTDPSYTAILKAIEERHWHIINPCVIRLPERAHTRKEDYTPCASIAFPLIEREAAEAFDIIAFWTDREGGFDEEEISILDTVTRDIMMALSAYKQRKLTERLQNEQITNYEETILAFVDMIEQRDAYTAGHTLRVARYARTIAEALEIDEVSIHKIEKAAILHDIGKIATPDTILLKPGRLNALEYELIKNHVLAGYQMLSKVKMYAELAEIMRYHHEHYDGHGYPYGYKHDEIPIESHILIVADAFDAMTSNRIYKVRMGVEEALEELERKSGSQFHPAVVAAALKVLREIHLSQTTQLPQSELENQRFAYFFNDNLTGLYNEAYLQLTLHQTHEQIYLDTLRLRHFTAYNHAMGWAKGNELLIAIANQLKARYPNAKHFRFEGDDFVIISGDEAPCQPEHFNLKLLDPQEIITLECRHYSAHNDEELGTIARTLQGN